MANILFQIGDWSCDGHSCYASLIAASNRTLEDAREIHYKENEFLGSLCKDYGDNRIHALRLADFYAGQGISEEQARARIQALLDSGIEWELSEEAEIDEDPDKDFELAELFGAYDFDLIVETPEQMLDIWLDCLRAIDPELKIERTGEAMSQYFIKYKGYPVQPDGEFHIWGFDKLGRHLKTPGYGIWTDHCGEFYHGVN